MAVTDSNTAGTGTSVRRTAVALGLRGWPLVSLLILLLVLYLLTAGASPSTVQVATTAFVTLVIVVGTYTFIGTTGVLSFGHIGFMAIGAYASALLTIPGLQKSVLLPALPSLIQDAELASLPAGLIAGALAAIFAAVIGTAIVRVSGIAAGIATLAMLIVVHTVIGNWDAVTRGRTTMLGVPTDTTLFGAFAVACLAVAVAFFFQESRRGLRLRASRDEPIAAAATGVNIERDRWWAFVLSAFICGVGGALYGHVLGAFGPDAFYIKLTFLTLAMLVVGGINSLAGAVVGSVLISVVAEVLRRLESGPHIGPLDLPSALGLREVVLALIMLVVLILRPGGIMRGRELLWPIGAERIVKAGRVDPEAEEQPSGAPPAPRPTAKENEA